MASPAAQIRAHRLVNAELIALDWAIGRTILDRQAAQGWGAKVIDQLAADLRAEFPEMTGLSRRNLHYMRGLAETWPTLEVVQQAAAQLPGATSWCSWTSCPIGDPGTGMPPGQPKVAGRGRSCSTRSRPTPWVAPGRR
ncbi:MAG: DUF1016 N-terminal domain-containing protein [Candidatus Nanopelagicales bacterium]